MATVVITGCSSGFGLCAALAFARHGDQVCATMRDLAKADQLQAAAEQEQLSLAIRTLDVSRSETFDSFLEELTNEMGPIDVLVNNAGIVRPGAVEDLPESMLREVMETNFFGPLMLIKAVLPQMRQQRGGCIINISSLSGLAGLPGDGIYAASKFALEGLTEALSQEVERWGIRLALLEPGLFATRIFDDPLKTPGLPDYVPTDSPYRPLTEWQLTRLRARLPEAPDPASVGELLVQIARSDKRQLRWATDPHSGQIAGQLLGLADADRAEFLCQASGTGWWTGGQDPPS